MTKRVHGRPVRDGEAMACEAARLQAWRDDVCRRASYMVVSQATGTRRLVVVKPKIVYDTIVTSTVPGPPAVTGVAAVPVEHPPEVAKDTR